MIKNTESSALECLMNEVAKVLAPILEATRLRKELNVRSLEDTCDAVEGAGYQIYRADLPSTVRGAAVVVDGKPYILTNRCDCCEQQRYTVSHELGHHVLHLNPSPLIAQLGLADDEDQELHADQFATAWFMQTAKSEQRERFLRENPRASFVLADTAMAVIFTVLPFVLLYAVSRLFSQNSPG
jgi:Zn-dependent peptidase ImmA (M78 family)